MTSKVTAGTDQNSSASHEQRQKHLRSSLKTSASGLSISVAGALMAMATPLAAPIFTVIAPNIANAQAVTPEVGGTIADPATGDELTIVAVFDGAVLTEDYKLVLTDPSVGADVPDPADAAQFIEVTAVGTNATTGLVETVTLSDGRVIDVARDVSGQIFPQTSADPLARFAPLAPADETRNTISTSFNGSDGDDGDRIPFNGIPEEGSNGGTRGATTQTYGGSRETIGATFGPITLFGAGIAVRGTGGDGGRGVNGFTLVVGSVPGRDGGNGGNGTTLTISNTGTISTNSPFGLYGMSVVSQGGDGGDGGDGVFGLANSSGGDGGNGGSGGTVTVNNTASGNITTYRTDAFGIYARSRGGQGGDGGDAEPATSSVAGSAGSAGNGGSVFINNFGRVHTFGASAHGLVGQSLGGSGGSGGDSIGIIGGSGAGSAGGRGGSVVLDNEGGGFIYTGGSDAHGILAQSIGGGGGAAGSSFAVVALGNSAGSGKEGGAVTVNNRAGGTIVTDGDRSFGMIAQSVGGGGGSAGDTGGLVAIGGSGGSGGIGRSALASNAGLITTSGAGAHGAVAQSIGGGGGTGSNSGGIIAVGGSGSRGGNAGTSRVVNSGTIDTSGSGAHGSLVQSIGGGGGNAGVTGGGISVGGSGATGGAGSTATFENRGLVSTSGDNAHGVLIQSIGGGGGNGATTGGLIAIGGSGSAGGGGGTVNVIQGGTITTEGEDAHGIVAQSIGGGGGNGGIAASVSAFVGVAVGGSGAAGGAGGNVNITFENDTATIDGVSRSILPVISTQGDRSVGIIAQSIGGGGGNGGGAYQVTAGAFGAVSVAVGGRGGGGSFGRTVNIDGNAVILTDGDFAHGTLAQSVGGGGGNGGGAVSVAASAGAGVSGSVSVGIGGRGGSGGAGGAVDLDFGGFTGTSGDYSHGIFAQSVGGGGGNGGFAVSVAAAFSDSVAVSIPVGVGGSGGSGGAGGLTDVDFTGDLLTEGDYSSALLAQSVGGGGGNGGFNISAGVSGSGAGAAGVAVGVGGTGGSGGAGGTANSSVTGNVMTTGAYSTALVTQSVGGSGGNGGYNISGTLTASGTAAGGVAVGVGGSGGGAGIGGSVTSLLTGDLLTTGDNADGILSQSVGGGGGNGGINISGNLAGAGTGAAGIAVGIGGSGGGGGNGGIVTATSVGNLETRGDGATAFTAQSLGGGGGNGALNVSGNITAAGNGAGSISVGVGGSGGTAGSGGVVSANVTGNTTTSGDDADAILAQSVGGSGGNGGINVSAGLNITSMGGTLSVGIGGAGGTGGNGGIAVLTVDGITSTTGDDSTAITAQSLGGGGGNGGVNVTAGVTLATGVSGNIGVGVGGKGGGGGDGFFASVTTTDDTWTTGARSAAILSQSIGGGGGNGGVNVTGTLSASTGGTGSLGVGVGGLGGLGGLGGTASANIGGTVMTTGEEAAAVTVQSLGGGGGNGGVNVTAGIALSGTAGLVGSVGVGGFGGAGGNGGSALLTRTGDTRTDGISSNAITVQSIGGGGGNGGVNIAGGLSFSGSSTSIAGAIGLGGFGGAAGNGGVVQANITGSAIANGADASANDFELVEGEGTIPLRLNGSHGVFAQSVGGSGGSGGLNISGGIALGGGASGGKSLSLGVGGFGGGGGDGRSVTVNATGALYQGTGDYRAAVFAQSVGGGGGDGGVNISGGIAMNGTLTAGVGGFGASGGRGGLVTTDIEGALVATGYRASGLVAQSLGGGGGNGGVNISGGLSITGGSSLPAIAFGLGGTGGAGSEGGVVNATHAGTISVTGFQSTGILAQSVGGGGGNGGLNVAAAVGGSKNFNLGIGFGGSGGAGSFGSAVTVNSDGQIIVDSSATGTPPADGDVLSGSGVGILAQSIGGGGGNGGFNIAGAGTNEGIPLTIGVGGSGAAGGMGGAVTVNRGQNAPSFISLMGNNDIGILAQSLGGGGGNAGGNLVLSGALKARFDVQLAIGGAAGDGADGDTVTVNHIGNITMGGDDSRAIFAQSIGGGGGNAAVNINGTLVREGNAAKGRPGTRTFDLQIGGDTGEGSDGGAVLVNHSGNLTTFGENSVAIFAQSIGGGGGNAAENISQNLFDESSLTVAIGRIGGSGGIGGSVDVITDGILHTEGEGAHGVFAQSIGGGGGNSETTSISAEGEVGKESKTGLNLEIAIGLEGGVGSNSGIVTVDNLGLIETLGDAAHGIYAQSIGGGGGNGGAAIIDRFSEIPLPVGGGDDPEREGSLAIQVGGAGGSGSFGSLVDVTNEGMILTFGDESNAIRAMSIGGGGGDGGAAFNVETPGDGNSLSFGVALGGEGGPGSDGGEVLVDNLGLLQTTGDDAAALFAQSIGGGGGNGGLAGNFSYLSPANGRTGITLDYNYGGQGGTGGIGGAVSVSNGALDTTGATILTTGVNSHGIHAQSIGGGGGNGGSTLSGNFANGSNAYQLAINIGGQGGSGGHAGLVTVDNFGAIETRGETAHGIFAQSIGGGGGNGGLSLALGNLYGKKAFPRQALIAVGGAGGNGNDAGNVVVNNFGTIMTSGDDAHGIFAQSLGGGGGNMSLGIALGFDPRVNAAVNFLSNTVGFLLGAQPGDGGLGGSVTVNHTGNITVSGDGAEGVVAQSLNGGGGGLSLDLSSIAGFVSGDLLPGLVADLNPVTNVNEALSDLPALTLFGGAAGAGDSNAELVTLNLTGDVVSLGDNGAGLKLQSIGGGGGQIDLNLEFTELADARAVALPVTSGLGGSDSTDVLGGDITSMQAGAAVTQGANTPAVFLQSIGGGGGRSILNFTGTPDQLGAVLLSLGGTNQTNAEGGAITHMQAGTIATLGDNSIGLLAQSIGGGGGATTITFTEASAPVTTTSALGTSALPANAPQSTLVLGADGGMGLDGGAVTITQTGDAMSAGDRSPALLVQSIGAGGGNFNVDGLAVSELTLGGSNAAAGNGGDISLIYDGIIMTEGVASHGVIVQSIGGGGGSVFGADENTQLTLSADNSGSGGAISYTQTGDIMIGGADASAIIAQSLGGGGGIVEGQFSGTAGGAGAGGAIDLLVDCSILILAEGTTAIVAQSLGADGGGDITLELASDRTIQIATGGTAIAFDGGADNLFTNFGNILSPDGLDALVMTGTSGNDVIQNFGTLVGNVALGGGTNGYSNEVDGLAILGNFIDLGSTSSLLSNAGTLTPGGTDTIVQTALSGSFAQSAGGITFMEVDLATDTHDAIDATGSIDLGGNVDVILLNTSDFTPGEKTYNIFTGGSAATLDMVDLRADSSVVLNLLGVSAVGNNIALAYDLTFAPAEALGNQDALGQYLDRIQTSGVSAALAPTFDQLIAVQDVDVYTDLLTQLGADFYAQQDAMAIGLSQQFGDTMVNCGSNGFIADAQSGAACAWAEARLTDTTLDAQPGSPGNTGDVTSFSGGAHYPVGSNVTLAIAVGYDDYDMIGYGDAWTAAGNAQQIGIGGFYDIGQTRFAALASYATAGFSTNRVQAGFGTSASSERDVSLLSAQLAVSHRFDLGGLAVLPRLSAGITSLGGGDTAEVMADPNNLALAQSSGTHSWVMPELRLAYDAPLSGSWNIRPYIGGSLRQYVSEPTVDVTASFVGDTSGAVPYLATTPLDRSNFSGEAGLEIFNTGGVNFGVSYRIEQSTNRDSSSAQVNLSIRF